MHDLLVNPLVHGALVGFGAAIGIDLVLFRSSSTWGEFFNKFDIKVASFRWVQGILFGALTESGLSAFLGI